VKYLLDTNACVRFLRACPSSDIGIRISQLGVDDEIVSCAIVRSELLFGALRSQNAVQGIHRVEAFLGPLASFPFDDLAAGVHSDRRAQLAKQGRSIGPFDLMIAAIAIANGLTVVTPNVGEFSRVQGLLFVDWQTTP
jgi:tRNA(fMet)-specific endonuclease VapC